MNEQSSKKILFNKSTLLSLKAELLKKQEEVLERKHLPQHNLEHFKPALHNAEKKKEANKDKKTFRDNLKAVDVEEFEACRKSKQALEKKAELYNHLSDGAGESQLAGQFLVDFKSKKQEAVVRPEPETEEKEDSIPFEDDQSEWIEFTDFLGRTRKCLKSDLDHYKKRDELLMKMVTNDYDDHHDSTDTDPQTSSKAEKPLLVQKTNDYLQSLREKWEQKENELLAKDRDIHYQDLLFDEARIHGVGYYAFSTEETERQKQMEELLKRREETLQAQKQAEEVRKKRDELIAARVAAARARQRIRAGLPPEDPEEKKKEFTTCLLQFLTQQKDEADKKAKEEDRKVREEQEKERQKLREAYVREWDIGKEGVKEKGKKFKEMTQEEYVEQQRDKRIDEFAPVQNRDSDNSKNTFDTKGRKIQGDVERNINKTWSDVRPMKTPPPPDIGDISDVAQKALYFTTKKAEAVVKYKNFVKAQEPVPIYNEIYDEDHALNTRPYSDNRCDGIDYVEVEPPATYDYYGPPIAKHRKSEIPFNTDLREAMAQGSKSLERKESTRKLPKHYDFTFD